MARTHVPTRPLLAVLALLIGLAAISACAGGSEAEETAVVPTAARTSSVVRFHLTGGFAGYDTRLTVRSDRRVTVTDRGEGTKRHTITKATLKRLRATLDAAHFEDAVPETQSGCADCFIYAIVYQGRTAAFDESQTPKRMARAVAELRRIAGGGR